MKNYNRQYGSDNVFGATNLETLFSGDRPSSGITVWKPHSYTKNTQSGNSFPIPRRGKPAQSGLNYAADLPLIGAYTPSEYSELVIKHRGKIGGKATNILDLVRTRKETISMITSNVSKLAKSISHLRRGKWKKAANALGVTHPGVPKSSNVPQRWLELQYGWMPLLSDVYALRKKIFREPVFSVRTTVMKNDDGFTSFDGYRGEGTYVKPYKAPYKAKRRLTYVTTFKIDSAAVTTLDNLGILNPSLVAWEAVPWSFIVDWFIPVGDWLGSMTDLKGVTLVNSCFTTVVDISADVHYNVIDDYDYPRSVVGSYKKQSYSKNRVIRNPDLVMPRFKNPLSLSHFANAMSLLATNIKRSN